MNDKTLPFDMADLLGSDAAISEYLNGVLADGDSDEVLRSFGHIARARGKSQVAKAFGAGAKPRFDTVLKVIRALGIDLKVQLHTASR